MSLSRIKTAAGWMNYLQKLHNDRVDVPGPEDLLGSLLCDVVGHWARGWTGQVQQENTFLKL